MSFPKKVGTLGRKLGARIEREWKASSQEEKKWKKVILYLSLRFTRAIDNSSLGKAREKKSQQRRPNQKTLKLLTLSIVPSQLLGQPNLII